MKILGMARLPDILRLGGALYVMPTTHAHLGGRSLEQQAKYALAGPFKTREAAALWIIAHLETTLTPPQLTLWGEALPRAGGRYADPFLLIGILDGILSGKSREWVLLCAGPDTERRDGRAAAAGEAA